MQTLADDKQFEQLIDRMAGAIQEDMRCDRDAVGWALVGIRSRGDILASRLAAKLGRDSIEGRVGSLDITLYRDDLSEIGSQAVVQTTDIPFNVDGLHIVLVDDVLMTGRSVRAAMQSLLDLGRPQRVWLNVLVDRGGRQLPIQADFAALDLNTGKPDQAIEIAPGDRVEVKLTPTDSIDAIVVESAQPSED